MTKKISLDAEQVYDLVVAIFEEYQASGEDCALSHAISLGLIEESQVTQEQLDDEWFDNRYDVEVGDRWYAVVCVDELIKKYGDKK